MSTTDSIFLKKFRGKTFAIVSTTLVCSLLLGAVSIRAQEPEAPDPVVEPPAPTFEAGQHGNSRHSGTYPTFDLDWRCADIVEGAHAVFPHPAISARAVVATVDGLQITEDRGLSWTSLPAGSIDRLGPVQSILFNSAWTDTFYVGSRTRGVWKTTDNGKTFTQIGSKATGLADDHVLRLVSFDGNRMLLVLHGDEAAGISRTLDGGRTWTVLLPTHYVYDIFAGKGVFISAATVADPYVTCLYIGPSLLEPWQELGRDIISTGFASSRLSERWTLISTANRGILRVTDSGGTMRNIAPAGLDTWYSIGSTWGATADNELVYAFDPTQLGLVVVNPSPKLPEGDRETEFTYDTASRGLLTSSLVREGAAIRANSNGMLYYACINSMLYLGERRGGETPVISVEVSPAVSRYDWSADSLARLAVDNALSAFATSPENLNVAAAILKKAIVPYDDFIGARIVTLTATVENDAEGNPPRQVTVDLSRLGYSLRSPLQAAGDGVYLTTFTADPNRFKYDQRDWRQQNPMGLTVTAVSRSGAYASGLGYLSAANTTKWVQFHGGNEPRSSKTAGMNLFTYESKVFRDDRKVSCMQINQVGPWEVTYSHGWSGDTLNTAGFDLFSFWILAKPESKDEIFIQLRDAPKFGLPTVTPKLGLLAGGYVPDGKFTGKFQKIVIPVADLIGDSEKFQPSIVSHLFFSGEVSAPTEYYIDHLVFFESEDPAVPAKEGL